MDKTLESEIADAEERLRLAMLTSDVSALDELLASSLVFTNHLGQRLSKDEDLLAHQSGALTISSLESSDQQITSVDSNVAIVSVRFQVCGKYAGQPADGDFRFTRVWAKSQDSKWQVVAAHASLIA